MNKTKYNNNLYIITPSDYKILKFKSKCDIFDNLIVGQDFDVTRLEEVDVSSIVNGDLQMESIIPEDLTELKQLKINSTSNALKKWCYEHPYLYNDKKYILSEEEYLRLGAAYNYYQMSDGGIDLYLAPMELPTETVSNKEYINFMCFISKFLRTNKDAISNYIASVNAATSSEEIESLIIDFVTPDKLTTE